jgi:hypothetical protein
MLPTLSTALEFGESGPLGERFKADLQSVPAYLLGPYVPRNRLIHNDGTSYFDNSAYTHTSFMHFVQNLWDLEGMNNRVQWAKTFEHVLLTEPRDDTPMELPRPFWFGGSSGYLEPPVCPGLNLPFPGEKKSRMFVEASGSSS